MTSEQNRQIADRIPTELNKHNLSVFDEVMGPDYVDHDGPPGRQSIADTQHYFTALFAAFPDLAFIVERVIAEGDFVVHHVTAAATMTGAFMGISAAGKRVTWSEMHIFRIVNGKVVEHWAVVEQMEMMTQLGLLPGQLVTKSFAGLQMSDVSQTSDI